MVRKSNLNVYFRFRYPSYLPLFVTKYSSLEQQLTVRFLFSSASLRNVAAIWCSPIKKLSNQIFVSAFPAIHLPQLRSNQDKNYLPSLGNETQREKKVFKLTATPKEFTKWQPLSMGSLGTNFLPIWDHFY